MKDKLNICNIYIAFWFIYSLQNILHISGMIAQVVLAANLLISLYYMWEVVRNPRIEPYLRALTVLWSMFTVYGIAIILSGEKIAFASMYVIRNFAYLKNIAISLLPIYPFYIFAKRGQLTEKLMLQWFWPLFIFAIVTFFYKQIQFRTLALAVGSSRVEFTNNSGYLFVSLFPIISFIRKKPLLQFALIALCLFFILSAMKRGAILTGFLMAIYMIYNTLGKTKGSIRFKVFFLSLVLVVVIFYSVDYFINTSAYFNHRIDATMSGDSSGRDRLYSTFWNHFLYDNTTLQFFFGEGALSTIKIGGNYAHNDWLEIAINQGLFGVLIYLCYWIVAFKTWLRSDKTQPYAQALGILFASAFLQSLFSMSYASLDFYSAMCLGFCLVKSSELDDDQIDDDSIEEENYNTNHYETE